MVSSPRGSFYHVGSLPWTLQFVEVRLPSLLCASRVSVSTDNCRSVQGSTADDVTTLLPI